MPHSIYECEGARECAIELRSFSKNAGFTGVRLGYTVVPKRFKKQRRRKAQRSVGKTPWHHIQRSSLHRSESRRSCLFPGRKGAAEDSDRLLYEECEDHSSGLERRGIYGLRRRERPYIWLKTPDSMNSWEFFDHLLSTVNIVGTPGSGFGAHGEGCFRLTAFEPENTLEGH